MARRGVQTEETVTVISLPSAATGSPSPPPSVNWSALRTTPLSNPQRMTSNPGAECPATLVYTPERCILEAVTLGRDRVLKQTKETV